MQHSQIPAIFADPNVNFFNINSMNQIEEYKKLRAFYDNDWYQIQEILFQEMKDKEIISDETTIEQCFISHLDNISKPNKRNCAGIFDTPPVITLQDENGKVITDNEYFNDLLDRTKFYKKIKEALLKAAFFNIALIQPVWREGEFEFDVLTPDMFAVIPKNDYYKIREIALQRVAYDENGASVPYAVVWNDKEHYKVNSATGNAIEIEGNKNKENPYGRVPFSILRMKDGNNFFGEPNYNLYRNQIDLDIAVSCNRKAIIMQSNQYILLTNVGEIAPDKNGKRNIKPNQVFNVNNVDKDTALPSMSTVAPSMQFNEMADHVKNIIEQVLSSEGLSGSSASTDIKVLSGVSKTIDELEIQENRDDKKETVYSWLQELIPLIITIYNTKPKECKILNYKTIGFTEKLHKVHIQLSEQKPNETIDDKIKRRDHEVKYFISTPLDFIMEDKEITEEDARKLWEENRGKGVI